MEENVECYCIDRGVVEVHESESELLGDLMLKLEF